MEYSNRFRYKYVNMDGEKICFFIAPIGEEGSEIRKRSDQVFNHIIKPVAQMCGYKAIRADHISKPGIITNQVIEYVVEAPLVIADLTGHNPNVFYELAIRHTVRKPVIQIINKGERIPFDIISMRTVHVDIHDLDSVEEAKQKIINQIRYIEEGKVEIDNPISTAIDIQTLRQSKESEQRSLADLIKVMAGRIEALANLEFNEKLAVMAGYKKNVLEGKDINIEKIKNDFLAVSNLKKWVDPEKREKLIVNYILPIIANTLEKENVIINHAEAEVLNEIIETALEYNIEIDKLKKLKKKLLSCKLISR